MREYVGARYVPQFYDGAGNSCEWVPGVAYEALTIVTHLNNSYTSKKPVPAGIDIMNEEYWANTGNYNAQVAEYQQQVSDYKAAVDSAIETISDRVIQVNTITDLKKGSFNSGDVVTTSGGIFVNDGGASRWLISDTAYPDDYNIQIANNKYARLIVSDYLTPEMFGAQGTGNADDSAAINLCFQYAKSMNIGNIQFRGKSAHYAVKNTINVPNGTGRRTIIEGNGSLITYEGDNWCFKFLSNFTDNWNTLYVMRNFDIDTSLNASTTAIGAIKAIDTCYYTFENINIDRFRNGCGIQLFVTNNVGQTPKWSEENMLRRLRVRVCKIGYQTMIAPDSYDGIDGAQSNNTISVNHNTWEFCTFNGKVNNAIGFDMHGNFSRCLWLSCGGWLNEEDTTGGLMFNMNGVSYGAELIQPWVDFGTTAESCIKISPLPAAPPFNDFLLISNVGSQFVLPSGYEKYVQISGNMTQGGVNYNQTGKTEMISNNVWFTPFSNGLVFFAGNVYRGSQDAGNFVRNVPAAIGMKRILFATCVPVLASSAVVGAAETVGQISGVTTDDNGVITQLKLDFHCQTPITWNYFVLGTRW